MLNKKNFRKRVAFAEVSILEQFNVVICFDVRM